MAKLTLVLVLALGLAGCGTPGSPSVPYVPSVNSHPVDQAPTCASRIGTLLTKADETGICLDPENRGDTTFIQPAGFTVCDNFEVYISFGDHLEGIEGQKAAWTENPLVLDRATCVTSPYVP